jgi:crotonobetainyl-CoA:carnitine CoA-transferase CaiB-like acyl-CoA transferase
LLADLGAEIIKVESPSGDSSRSIPPHFIGGDSVYYLANNRNKRSVVVDLKTPGGLEVVRQLIGTVDVVVENFRPGVCARLGLDPHKITASNPELVWASISGFGQFGPGSGRPAYDMIVQALSGVMSITGQPGQPASRLGIPAGDVIAGLYACIGLLSALVARNETGRGRMIDVSMLDAQIAQLNYQASYALVTGVDPGPQGAAHDSIPTYRSFRGKDGSEFVVTANTDAMWRRLCAVIGRTDLARDARFHDQASRLQNRAVLWDVLESTFSEKLASEWVDLLIDAAVPAAPIVGVHAALEGARTAGRGMIVSTESTEGPFESVGSPILFEGTLPPRRVHPPRLGAHTVDVLRADLGLDDASIDRLLREGAVASPDLLDHHR